MATRLAGRRLMNVVPDACSSSGLHDVSLECFFSFLDAAVPDETPPYSPVPVSSVPPSAPVAASSQLGPSYTVSQDSPPVPLPQFASSVYCSSSSSRSVSRLKACCRCNRQGKCKNCSCVKQGKICAGCLPSREGSCSNLRPSPSQSSTTVQVPPFLLQHPLLLPPLVLFLSLPWMTYFKLGSPRFIMFPKLLGQPGHRLLAMCCKSSFLTPLSPLLGLSFLCCLNAS